MTAKASSTILKSNLANIFKIIKMYLLTQFLDLQELKILLEGLGVVIRNKKKSSVTIFMTIILHL